MLCKMWFRKINLSFGLIAASAFIWSCSEGPTPGPMSPLNSGGKSRSAAVSGVRPVKRQMSQALAKSGYDQAQVVQRLQDVSDELKAIVDKNPGTSLAYKLNSSVGELNRAITNLMLRSSNDDDDDDDDDDEDNGDASALYRISRAKSKIQDALNRGMLLAAQGEQFKKQLAEVENQITNGFSPAGDYRGQSKSLWIKNTHGGLIKFAGHSIDVPKYATKQDAEFSISVSPNDYITVDFGPDGYFEQYLTVTISYKDADLNGIDPSKLTLAWFDEKAGQWIDLGGVVDLVKKTVTAKNNHFTQYTLATK